MLPQSTSTVGDEDLVVSNLQPPVAILGLSNRMAEELIALLGSITVDVSRRAHVIDGLVHGVMAASAGVSDIAYAQRTGAWRLRFCSHNKLHAPADLRER